MVLFNVTITDILNRCNKTTISTQNLCRRQLIIHEVCVLDLNGLVSAWRRGKHPRQLWLSPCQIVSLSFVWDNANQGIWTFVKFKKKTTCYFQANWISCILNWGVCCDFVSDAGHTCCCCSLFPLTFDPPNWRTSLTSKKEVSVRQQI